MTAMTLDDWKRFYASQLPDATVPELEQYRNAHNISVEGLPDPTYNGPLSSGGSAGAPPPALAQGPTTVADTASPAPAQAPSGALPGPAKMPEAQAFLANSRALTDEEKAAYEQGLSGLASQYNAGLQNIQARRFGPSRTEQLFNLAAAIGTPMIRPSFGGVMANVAPALSNMEAAARKAQDDRAAALMALQQSYTTQKNAMQNEFFKNRRLAMAPEARVVAAIDKPQGPIARATVDPLGASHNKVYGNAIYQPPVGSSPQDTAARMRFLQEQRALKDFLANNQDPAAQEQAKRAFDDHYGFGAADVYGV
jgi:hypothetical protein